MQQPAEAARALDAERDRDDEADRYLGAVGLPGPRGAAGRLLPKLYDYARRSVAAPAHRAAAALAYAWRRRTRPPSGSYPAIDTRYTLAERIIVHSAIRLMLSGRPARGEFFQGLVFLFLPFKAAWTFMVLFRNMTRRGDLDTYFMFFNGKKVHRHLDWIIKGPLVRRFANDVFFYLMLNGNQREALTLFRQLDWRHCECYFIDAFEDAVKRIASGYVMNIIARFHQIDWTYCPEVIRSQLYVLANQMLEHRLYRYEECIFASKLELGEDLDGVTAETYCPHFFQDKDLILSLIADLQLEGSREIVEQLEAQGQYWEHFHADDPDREVLCDIALFYAYRHLYLRTYHNGEGRLVPLLCRRSLATQQRLQRSLPPPSRSLARELDHRGIELADLKLLSPDWSALIGHNGHLNVHLMMREMGWWRGSPVLLAYPARIANRAFLSLFRDLCPTVILGENFNPDVWHELASLTPFLGVSHQVFAFEDGRTMYWNDAGAMALNQWEAEGRGFPLREIYDRRLQEDDSPETLFASLRRKWGMAPDDWHVCLHMRDAETRGERHGIGESIRSASLDSYLDAVRHVTASGGWVIRMGGRKVPPMPDMPRVIDYARCPDQVPEMDIHLVRRARMFIGTTSGFAYVASSFGIPTAMVNAISSVGLLWSTDTRFALKPVHTRDGRMLSLRELTSEQWRWAYPTHESVARAGLTVSESSADEILETVKEVLDLSMAGSDDGSVDDAWQKCLSIPAFFGSARPARYFLDKYAEALLTDADGNVIP